MIHDLMVRSCIARGTINFPVGQCGAMVWTREHPMATRKYKPSWRFATSNVAKNEGSAYSQVLIQLSLCSNEVEKKKRKEKRTKREPWSGFNLLSI